MDVSKIDVVKTIVGVIAGAGASSIIKTIIANNVGEPQNVIHKITVPLGTLAIAGVVSSAAIKHTDQQIDTAVGWIDKLTKPKTEEVTEAE